MRASRAAKWCLLASLALPLARAVEEAPPLEYQVKAAFLLNFTKFIDWPQAESTGVDPPFDICILGDDPFGMVLDQIVEGETFQGRKLTVQRMQHALSASCKVVFVSKSEKEKDIEAILAGLGTGVLTVSDRPGFLRAGGMVEFVIENRRVRFDINEAAASRAGLKLSSRLLSVARSVEK
jgi:hypothetical protein